MRDTLWFIRKRILTCTEIQYRTIAQTDNTMASKYNICKTIL